MADRRKLENIAVALPIFGAAMILPPVVGVFAAEARIIGVPVIVIYFFSMWVLFIFGAYLLSRRLKTRQETKIVDESGG